MDFHQSGIFPSLSRKIACVDCEKTKCWVLSKGKLMWLLGLRQSNIQKWDQPELWEDFWQLNKSSHLPKEVISLISGRMDMATYAMVSINLSKPTLASRVAQYHKSLLHISNSIGASYASFPQLLVLTIHVIHPPQTLSVPTLAIPPLFLSISNSLFSVSCYLTISTIFSCSPTSLALAISSLLSFLCVLVFSICLWIFFSHLFIIKTFPQP